MSAPEDLSGAWVYCCRCWCRVMLRDAIGIGDSDLGSWLCEECARVGELDAGPPHRPTGWGDS